MYVFHTCSGMQIASSAFGVVSPYPVPSGFLPPLVSLSAGSVPCLEVEAAAAAAEVEAAARLPRHLSHLHCQSINLQTIATGEKKC